MTILDKINIYLPLIKAEEVNAVLLGRLECQAYLAAFEQIFQVKLSIDELHSCTHHYRGLRILPLATPSSFILVHTIEEEVDAAIRV